jgi:hypothetical protein
MRLKSKFGEEILTMLYANSDYMDMIWKELSLPIPTQEAILEYLGESNKYEANLFSQIHCEVEELVYAA